MNLVLRTLLATALAFAISCARSSDDSAAPANGAGNNKTDNSAFKNVAGSVLGQWSAGNGLSVFISETRLKLEAQCENKPAVQAEVSISMTANAFTLLEAKSVGDANCSLELKKGSVVKYFVKDDNLTLQVEGQEPMELSRIQAGSEPAPNNGNGGTNSQTKYELYSSPNCTGQKMIYTVGMNCTELGGKVSSYKQFGNPQCQNLNPAEDSRALCENTNQKLAKGKQ